MSDAEAGPALTRFDFPRGRLQGTHFTLYPTCLLHRGEQYLENVPLAAVASLRVAYERDPRKLGWGASLLIIALLLFAISGPLTELAAGAAAEMAAAGGSGVAKALHQPLSDTTLFTETAVKGRRSSRWLPVKVAPWSLLSRNTPFEPNTNTRSSVAAIDVPKRFTPSRSSPVN